MRAPATVAGAARRVTSGDGLGRYALPLLVLVIAFTYPWWHTAPGLSVIFQDALRLELDVAIVIAVYVMLALGLNIVVGYAGLLDLGYVAFYAIGAYTVGWFASTQFAENDVHFLSWTGGTLPGIHINIWLVIILSGVVTAIAGILIGWPTLRLRGDYLAIVTLGFGEIIPDVFRNADSLPIPFRDPVNLTNGVRGIKPLDKLGFGETLETGTGGFLPARFGLLDLKPWFVAIFAMVLITVFVNQRMRDSKLGRAWVAVREDEVAAAAMGIPLMRTKLWAYAMGGVFGGFAGAYYGSFIGSVFPTSFFFNISIIILVMVIVGGMGNIWGVVAGAVVVQYLNVVGLDIIGDKLNQGLGAIGTDQRVDIPKYKFLIFGILLVGMMLVRPEGLIPSAQRKAEFHEEEEEPPPSATSGAMYEARS
jgi:branched-chain amino acid transport system permease protein